MLHPYLLLVFTTLLMHCDFTSTRSDPVADICSPLCDEETVLETECAKLRGCYDLNVSTDLQVFTECWTPCWDAAGQCFSLCADNFDDILQQCYSDCRPSPGDVSCIASCFKIIFLDIKNRPYSSVNTTIDVSNTSTSSFPNTERSTMPTQTSTTHINNTERITDGDKTHSASTPDLISVETTNGIYNETKAEVLLDISTTSKTVPSSSTLESSVPEFSDMSDIISSVSPPPVTIQPFSELQMGENTLQEKKTTSAKPTEQYPDNTQKTATPRIVPISSTPELQNVYNFSRILTQPAKTPWSQKTNILDSFRQALAIHLKINVNEHDINVSNDHQINFIDEVQRNKRLSRAEPSTEAMQPLSTRQPSPLTHESEDEESKTKSREGYQMPALKEPQEHIFNILLRGVELVGSSRKKSWFKDN